MLNGASLFENTMPSIEADVGISSEARGTHSLVAYQSS